MLSFLKILQQSYLRIYTFASLIVLACASLFLTACNSTSLDATTAPKMEIQNVTLHNQDSNTPYFVIDYVLTNNSDQPLPLQGLNADIYLNGTHAAAYDQSFTSTELVLAPHQSAIQQFEVPANLLTKASIDSLNNTSLVVLRGTCALQAIFTTDASQQIYNPSSSYSGLFQSQKSASLNNLEQISARSELTPQSSATPLPRKEPQQEQSNLQITPPDTQSKDTPSAATPTTSSTKSSVAPSAESKAAPAATTPASTTPDATTPAATSAATPSQDSSQQAPQASPNVQSQQPDSQQPAINVVESTFEQYAQPQGSMPQMQGGTLHPNAN